ncbi:CRISPR-associated endonuclease Cas1 [Synechococcus sp. R6-10]|uniref:CRISPR-associated endonuclease Cas1 n=1 Tax=Synechococcus sp. R6-10 TaxID=2291956 RepID=UPI0039C273B0
MGRTLYVSQQDCYLSLDQERLVVKRAGAVLQQAQLPHLDQILMDQILIFGHAQVTTQLIQSCLERNIPIAYLSHMGYCAGPSSTGRCRPTSSL